MSDKVGDILQGEHAAAYAAELSKREALIDTIRAAYQNPDEAIRNFSIAFLGWGIPRTVDTIRRQPDRLGIPHGARYTRDGWTPGARDRADIARSAIDRLPDLILELEKSQDRERIARAAYERYCRERGIDPVRPWERERRVRVDPQQSASSWDDALSWAWEDKTPSPESKFDTEPERER